MSPLLYTAELALDPDDREAFLRWYAFRHAPDLYAIGFCTCTCYQAIVGDMTFFDIYEIDSLDMFDSPGYARMAERDVYAAEILDRRRDKAHAIYEQRFLAPAAAPDGPSLDADWLSVLRFDASLNEDELASRLAGEANELRRAGASRVRLAERTRDHPVYTTRRPHFMLVVEWPARPPERSAKLENALTSLGAAATEVVPFFGRRVFPWPDAPYDNAGAA